jgi:phosphatidate cytidylyltransferase
MTLLKRTASGVAAGGLVFAILYVGARFNMRWIVAFPLVGIGYPAGVEYVRLLRRMSINLSAPEFLAWIPILLFSYVLFGGNYADVVLLFAVALQVLRYLGKLPHRDGLIQSLAAVFGLLYIPWLLHFFYLIYTGGIGQSPHVGAVHALVVLLMVWGYDSGGFFVGTAIGRHPAFPTISPKKTWEGIGGGFLFAILGGFVGATFSPVWREYAFGVGALHVVACAVLVGWSVQLGDLFASKLKRAADVKDSGHFLPGHGGVLDRIDGMLFALPVFYFYFHYVVRFL